MIVWLRNAVKIRTCMTYDVWNLETFWCCERSQRHNRKRCAFLLWFLWLLITVDLTKQYKVCYKRDHKIKIASSFLVICDLSAMLFRMQLLMLVEFSNNSSLIVPTKHDAKYILFIYKIVPIVDQSLLAKAWLIFIERNWGISSMIDFAKFSTFSRKNDNKII